MRDGKRAATRVARTGMISEFSGISAHISVSRLKKEEGVKALPECSLNIICILPPTPTPDIILKYSAKWVVGNLHCTLHKIFFFLRGDSRRNHDP
jgi:hypothetical protein